MSALPQISTGTRLVQDVQSQINCVSKPEVVSHSDGSIINLTISCLNTLTSFLISKFHFLNIKRICNI